jgi:hypothetical protein
VKNYTFCSHYFYVVFSGNLKGRNLQLCFIRVTVTKTGFIERAAHDATLY